MSIKRLYYGLIYGIPNLFIWFKVIWKDRDWDNYHIYVLLCFKLNRMAKSFEKYDIHVDAEKKVQQLKLCVLLLERLIADEYAEAEWDKAIDYKNWKIGEVLTEEDKRLLKIAQIKEDYMRNQDLDLLFSSLRKYIEGWWD